MRKFLLIFLLALTSFAVAATEPDPAQAQAKRLLQQAQPSIDWHAASSLRIDIDDDGRPDYVFLAVVKERANIGVVLGANNRVIYHFYDWTCGGGWSLEPYNPDSDPAIPVGSPVPGFEVSKTAHSFALAPGDCDAYNFFWNRQKNDIDLWRL